MRIRVSAWTCENPGSQTYNHGSQVVRAVVIWSCPIGFEGLLTISINLVLVDAVKVFAKNVQGSGVVANQDLESANLIEVERTMVAKEKTRSTKTRDRINGDTNFVEVFSSRASGLCSSQSMY